MNTSNKTSRKTEWEDHKMNEIKRILMQRDGMSSKEAEELMEETRDALESGDFEAMQDYLGLEDDYIFDLLF